MKILHLLGVICLILAIAISLPGGVSLATPAANAPDLGSAVTFSVIGGTTVTNTGATLVSGDLGVSPGSAVTGFPPGIVTGVIHAADAIALQAQNDVITAYDDLAGQTCDMDLSGTDLGGLTLVPGVYCFAANAQLTGQLTLDAAGDPAAVFIFKVVSGFDAASAASVIMTNNGSACNVYWQIGSSVTLGTGASLAGNVLVLTSISVATNANIEGRAFARNGAVTLDANSVGGCTPALATPTDTPGPTATNTVTTTLTSTPISTLTVTATPISTLATTATSTVTGTLSVNPTDTPGPVATDTPSPEPTERHTATPAPSDTPGPVVTNAPSDTPGPGATDTPGPVATDRHTATPGPVTTSAPSTTPGPGPTGTPPILIPTTGAASADTPMAPTAFGLGLLAFGLILVGLALRHQSNKPTV